MTLLSPPTVTNNPVPDTYITPTNSADAAARAAANGTVKPDIVLTYPLYMDDLVLTGLDGIGKPINEHLQNRVVDAKVDLTIEGASTITVTFADPDREVLRSPVLSTGLPTVSQVATELLNDVNTLGIVSPTNNSASLPGGSTYSSQVAGGAAAGDEATRNQQLVVQIGVNLGLPRQAVVIALMTLLDESGGINVLTPDSNGSYGIFQQTPTQGWGTIAQVTDPVYATNKFYQSLQGLSGWQNMDPWVAAQMVQRSAWTGNPNSNNNYSSELGGNYHAVYDQALQLVQAYRPESAALQSDATTINAAHSTGVRRKLLLNQGNKLKQSVGFQAHAATAHITYKGVDFSLVRVDTQASKTILTFEDSMINQLRRNRDPYTSAKPTSVPLFINQLLLQDGFSYHFVQQGLVVKRVDPTGILDAGLSDPASLANFDQLVATDGQRGTGTLRQFTKFASVTTVAAPDPITGQQAVTSSNGVINDSWTTIANLVTPLRWVAMSNGKDFYIGSEQFVSHYLNQPPILVAENQDNVGWFTGEFDLGTETSNTLSFQVSAPFVGVAGQRVIVQDAGLLSGLWMIHNVSFSAFSVQTSVTCQRIQADLEDAEAQKHTDALLTTGGGITTTNAGVLAGSKPSITGQTSQNGWAAGDRTRAAIQSFTVPGTQVLLPLNATCGPLLVYVAQLFNEQVEPLNNDCYGYADRFIRGNTSIWSNHASGTAIDLNSGAHPLNSAPLATFTQDKIDKIHAIVKGLSGAVRWGGDYTGRVDSMHFEINTDQTGIDTIMQSLGLGIYSHIGQGHITGGH